MFIAYAAIVTILNAIWLAANLVGLPGNWLIVGTTVAAWVLTDKRIVSPGILISLLVLALLGELLEFALGAAGAKKAGGSRRGALGAMLGAVLGGIAGTFVIPIPIVGSIAGAAGGAFIGAVWMELSGDKSIAHAMRIGRGAAVGRLWGAISKLVLGAAMWLTAAIASFWP